MKLIVLAALLVSSVHAALDCSTTTLAICALDETLMRAAGALLGACTSEGVTLQTSLSTATNQSQFSSAWETFCTGSCATGIAVLQPQHDCCVAIFGLYASLINMKASCRLSTQNAGRRCGAELFSLGAVQCAASNAADCTNLGSCEWISGMNQCVFKPTQQVLDAMCTTCNREYFQNFTTGGMNPIGEYSKLASVFDFACSKVDGQYCLLAGQDVGFHMPNELTPTDMATLCAPTAAATKKRRCYRSLTTATARGLVREARAAYETCSASDGECQATLGGTLALASALERSAASVCTLDSNTSTNCFGAGASLMSDSCFLNTVGTSNCSASCDANVTAAVTAAGCCGASFAKSGVAVLMQSPYPGRLLFASAAGSSKNVNMTTAKLGSAGLALALGAAAGTASTNYFAAVGTCPSFASSFAEWDASASAAPCVQRPFSRTYNVTLYAAYSAFNACANKQVVLGAIVSDIAVALGATPQQFTSTTTAAAASGDLTVRFTVTADTASEIDAMDATMKPAALFFTTTGREIAFACPAMLPYQIASNLAVGAQAVASVGDQPLPTTASPAPTTTLSPPTRPVSGATGISSAATVAASVLGLAVAALALM